MSAALQFTPVLIMIILECVSGCWNKLPFVRARWARLSLHDKITRTIRTVLISIFLETGWIASFTGLYVTGWLTSYAWLTGMGIAGVGLIANLFLLHYALAALRAYKRLGTFVNWAEARHASSTVSANSGQLEN